MFKFINSAFVRNEVCNKVLKTGEQLIWDKPFSRGIVLKQFLDNKDKPAPFPWETVPYNWVVSLFDNTTKRFDENSKIIVVDGPVGAGKHKLAKELADELGMKYVPQANTDIMYINEQGYDMRNLDEKMPDSCKSYDEKNFCIDPYHRTCASFQINMYRLRFAVYFDILAHLLNTGQGVVTVRSPFSDCVFANAMYTNKFMSRPAHETYFEIVRQTIFLLLRPHLIIYLDAPVEDTLRNIKERNRPHEVNAPGLKPDFLKCMELEYKKNYLVAANIKSKMLVYNWSEGGDTEVVLEDIEKLDFDKHIHWQDPMLSDWRLMEQELDYLRVRYSVEKVDKMFYFLLPLLDAPELLIPGQDTQVKRKVWLNAPGMKYKKGYDPERGDKNIWLKSEFDHRDWEPTA